MYNIRQNSFSRSSSNPLTDKQVDKVMRSIEGSLVKQLGAEVRR